MATMQTLSGKDPEPIGNAHFVHVPYNTFTAQDGFIVIAVITNAFWNSLLDVVDIESLRNPEFIDQPGRLINQDFIEQQLNEKLSTKPSQYWIEELNNAKVPCGPINKFSEALADEQVLFRNMVVEVEHPDGGSIKMPGNPVKLSYTDGDDFTPPPHLGQDTREVLKTWAGYDASKIENLISNKIIQVKD
jgi:crotonobetainyl-CoA:carnitine CoA-transferase CaiB-like acyl-CoA transferase